jgi:hypothetical protein
LTSSTVKTSGAMDCCKAISTGGFAPADALQLGAHQA